MKQFSGRYARSEPSKWEIGYLISRSNFRPRLILQDVDEQVLPCLVSKSMLSEGLCRYYIGHLFQSQKVLRSLIRTSRESLFPVRKRIDFRWDR